MKMNFDTIRSGWSKVQTQWRQYSVKQTFLDGVAALREKWAELFQGNTYRNPSKERIVGYVFLGIAFLAALPLAGKILCVSLSVLARAYVMEFCQKHYPLNETDAPEKGTLHAYRINQISNFALFATFFIAPYALSFLTSFIPWVNFAFDFTLSVWIGLPLSLGALAFGAMNLYSLKKEDDGQYKQWNNYANLSLVGAALVTLFGPGAVIFSGLAIASIYQLIQTCCPQLNNKLNLFAAEETVIPVVVDQELLGLDAGQKENKVPVSVDQAQNPPTPEPLQTTPVTATMKL